MNQSDNQSWTHQESYDALAHTHMSDDDFANFLDLDSLDFPIFDQNGDLQNAPQPVGIGENTIMADASDMLNLEQYGDMSRNAGQMGELPQSTQQHHEIFANMDYSAQQPYQEDPMSYQMTSGQNYMGQFSVPPTPNSAQMCGMNGQYLQQSEPHVSYHGFQTRKDDIMASLTPLVSPQIPGSAQSFSVLPEYTMPGAYLSPLTSPAINPQPNTSIFHAYTQPNTADSSLTGSPIDLNFDLNCDVSTNSDERRPRRPRKKAVSTKSSVVGSRSRPTSMVQRRKCSISVAIPNGALTETQVCPPQSVSASTPTLVQGIPSGHAPSSQHLTDVLMAPPPRPGSVNNTPIATPRSMTDVTGLPAATPASLMRLRQQQQQAGAPFHSPLAMQPEIGSPVTGALGSSMEDLRLPDAVSLGSAADKQQLTPRVYPQEPKPNRDGMGTPIMTGSRTPRAILPSPAFSAKADVKAGRNPRKRGSPKSVLVSPAIRPKISPSIKPLFPDTPTTAADETQALLATTKSNYQNIIEGTTLPGVTYPAELSTNLTSKRTSHKIAEQGRRNRINVAIQEMETLLPGSPVFLALNKDADGGGGGSPEVAGDGEGAGKGAAAAAAAALQGGNSKAATVEMAIEYIRHLKSTLADKETENERLKAEMLALKEKMEV